MKTSSRALAASSVALIGAATALTVVAAPASAAPALTVAYDASGSTVVTKPNSTIKLGPTTLTNYLNADGTFTADLPLPATTSQFKVIGLVPVKATVNFVPTGPATGKLVSNPTPAVSATATYYIKLSNVTLAGIPAFVGTKCQTSAPVSIPVATPAGQKFDITKGGNLTGTYTIGKFANCGLTTGLVNLLVPGAGNTVQFTLSNGRIVS